MSKLMLRSKQYDEIKNYINDQITNIESCIDNLEGLKEFNMENMKDYYLASYNTQLNTLKQMKIFIELEEKKNK